MIIIQEHPLIINQLILNFKSDNPLIGAVVTFQGYVRDFDNTLNGSIKYLEIEFYEEMTKKELKKIEETAKKKWELIDIAIIHRFGRVSLNEPIVCIIVSSKHRDDAFDACRFIIDYLKIQAPFWKKEVSRNHSSWVEQKKSDLVKVK